MRWKIVIMMVVIFVVAGIVLYLNYDTDDPVKLIASIEKFTNKVTHELEDWHNDIGVKSVSDVGYKVDDKGTYYLCYGKVEIKLTDKDLAKELIIQKLKNINITVLKNRGTGAIKFQYKGQDIEKFVK
ncbi:MAG: hypothetical protein LBS29_04505 [Endomicrobium sp.]|jgi:hypothetical protein|nr:hypothetical protein [Endomicrobium sp.]